MRIKGLEATLEAVKEAINNLPKELFQEIADYASKRIQAKARTGKTMITGKEEPLKPLSTGYVNYRDRLKKGQAYAKKQLIKRLKKQGDTEFSAALQAQQDSFRVQTDSEYFSPKRSNLTFSGQYLKSIRPINVDQRLRLITIGATGSRKDGQLTNDKLSRYLTDQGRSIWGIDMTARKVIRQKVIDQIRRNLKKR